MTSSKVIVLTGLIVGFSLKACIVEITNDTEQPFILQQKNESKKRERQHELRELNPEQKTVYGDRSHCAHFHLYQQNEDRWTHTHTVDQMGCGRTKEKFLTISGIVTNELGPDNQPLFEVTTAGDGDEDGEDSGCGCKR